MWIRRILAGRRSSLKLAIPGDRSPTSPRRRSPASSGYMWVDRNGRPVSPPSNHSRSPSYNEKSTYKKVIVAVEDDLTLGLMIRGGAEYGLGIYITGVDAPSAADIAGLQIGDQILSVNDIDFTNITHDEAVSLLQSSPHMSMVVRSEGKVPHSTIPYSSSNTGASTSGAWYTEPAHGRSELSRKGSPRKRDHKVEEPKPSTSTSDNAQHRLERKSRKVLTESQKIMLDYYCNEYETGVMSVDAFVSVLLEQLDTPEKYSLMTEIRSLVRDEDLDKFDELIYRRELQVMKVNLPRKTKQLQPVEIRAEHADDHVSPPVKVFRLERNNLQTMRRRQQQQDVHHLTVPDHPEDMHTPSEDSGVDLANGAFYGHGSRKGSRVSTGSRDSITIETKQLQRKPSPWRTSPRSSTRKSFDGTSSLRDGNQATRMRRTTFRRHSSGGEGVNPEDRRPRHRSHEDRRWSIGSELVDTPFVEGHLVLNQLATMTTL
ncbi:PDZ domain-containing protein 7-like [Uloborus diversus]|uniref:PDZ domain-containing protein 7-like n=1 Tax=Uloborus diversus TaxID=327109 RepID=UPI0024099720|nr:PDZ domain-containing protein 7-like [Uloborus diversus]